MVGYAREVGKGARSYDTIRPRSFRRLGFAENYLLDVQGLARGGRVVWVIDRT
jgi:hypothetical protein